jgi:hypothetical protein
LRKRLQMPRREMLQIAARSSSLLQCLVFVAASPRHRFRGSAELNDDVDQCLGLSRSRAIATIFALIFIAMMPRLQFVVAQSAVSAAKRYGRKKECIPHRAILHLVRHCARRGINQPPHYSLLYTH